MNCEIGGKNSSNYFFFDLSCKVLGNGKINVFISSIILTEVQIMTIIILGSWYQAQGMVLAIVLGYHVLQFIWYSKKN